MKLNKIFPMSIFLICLIFAACNTGSTSEADLLRAKITAFQAAVTAKDNTALKALISSDAQDYSLMDAGTYFTSTENIFNDYIFVYSGVQSSIIGTDATVTATVTGTDRETHLPLNFSMTATFLFKKETSGNWLITQLSQVKIENSGEEVLLDNLRDQEIALLELLENNNGTILY